MTKLDDLTNSLLVPEQEPLNLPSVRPLADPDMLVSISSDDSAISLLAILFVV